MLLVPQMYAEDEKTGETKWIDIAVPHGISYVLDWQEKLRQQGVVGTFRVVGFEPSDDTEPVVHTFEIKRVEGYECVDL